MPALKLQLQEHTSICTHVCPSPPPPSMHTQLYLFMHLSKYGNYALYKVTCIARGSNNVTKVVLQTKLPHTEHNTLMWSHSHACCPTLLWRIFGHRVEQTRRTDQGSAPQPHSPTARHPAQTLDGGSNNTALNKGSN